MKKGWKAVYKEHGGGYISAIQQVDSGGIDYTMNRWVYPLDGCGPLAVFTTEESVKFFIKGRPYCTYFPCFYMPSDLACVWYHVFDLFIIIKTRQAASLPDDTALARKVMLFMPIQIA